MRAYSCKSILAMPFLLSLSVDTSHAASMKPAVDTIAECSAGAGQAGIPAKIKMPAADLLDRLDRFREQLSADDRARLDKALPRSANGGIVQCDNVNESRASCENGAYFIALGKTGLLQAFYARLCLKS